MSPPAGLALGCLAGVLFPLVAHAQSTPTAPAPRTPSAIRCQLPPASAGPMVSPLASVAIQYSVGAMMTAIVVPAMISSGSQLQGLTGDLVGSLFLSAVPYLAVVPLAVTGIQSLVAGSLRPASNYGGWAALATTLGTVGLLLAGHAMGVSTLDGGTMVAFTVLNATLLPALSAAVMFAASPRPCDRAASASRCGGGLRVIAGGVPFRDALGAMQFPVLGGSF